MDCRLKSLELLEADFPSSNGNPISLTGLKSVEDTYKIDREYFCCCSGSGLRFVEENNFSSAPATGVGTLSRCDLEKRLKRVNSLLNIYRKYVPEPNINILTRDQVAFLIKWSREFRNGSSAAGNFVDSAFPKVSLLWTVGFYLSWYQGLKVKIVCLDEMFESEIFSELELCDVVLIGNLDKTWDPSEMIKLDRLIDYCYSGAIPIWMFYSSKISLPPPSKRVRLFERKLHRLKTMSVAARLSPSSLHKLKSVCRGISL